MIRSRAKSKSTILEFLIQSPQGDWRVLTQPGVRATEESIRKTLRLDYETFVNASFFLQGKAEMFATQTPGKRKELLGSILGLEVWEEYRKEALRRMKEAEAARDAVRGTLGILEKDLDSEPTLQTQATQQQDLLSAAEAERKACEGELESARRARQALASQKDMLDLLARQAASASQKQTDLQTALDATLTLLEASRARLARAEEIESAHAAWQQLSQELEAAQALAERFNMLQTERQHPEIELKTVGASLRQELLELQRQERDSAARAREIPSYESEIALRQIDLEKARQAETDAAALQSGMDELQQESGQLRRTTPS